MAKPCLTPSHHSKAEQRGLHEIQCQALRAHDVASGTVLKIRCMKLLRALLLSAFAGILVQAPSAWGQSSYPARPIRIIVPFSPGGGGDLTARKIAVKLAERTGGSVFVENRAGASGNIGMEAHPPPQPDGYTLIFALNAQLAVNPSHYKKIPYDPGRDYQPNTQLGTGA